jgi:hypothetical protein
MPGPEIHIDRVRFDLRGISPDIARDAVASLGPALGAALAARTAKLPVAKGTSLGPVAAPALHVPAGADAATLRAALADQLATAIARQISAASAPPTSTR